LYCDSNGQISKPFPDKPYCEQTQGNIGVVNNAGGIVSFCQTVLPGNEAMIIPTEVNGYATLANPGPDYWCGTAAHYYINPPGIGAGQGCVWGSKDNPWGNWSPYVAGANTDANGQTFLKLGWNPIYLEPMTPFRNNMPDWGVSIECPNGGCNGLPCAIDPSQNNVNQMRGGKAMGAGGGNFCVVTVSPGAQANIVVTGPGGGNGGQFYGQQSSSEAPSSTTTWEESSTWSSSWAEWSSSSSYSWSVENATSYTPTSTDAHQPKYTLFDTEPASTPTSSDLPKATLTSPAIADATSGANRDTLSLVAGAVGLLAAVAQL
jgi:hypothetical protein